jgi:hypothetical protein
MGKRLKMPRAHSFWRDLLGSSNLEKKILSRGMVLAVVPMILVIAATLIVQRQADRISASGLSRLAFQDLNHTVKGLLGACKTYNEDIEKALKGAKVLLDKGGPVRFTSRRKIDWKAKNELSSEVRDARLPFMVVGRTRIKPVADFSREAPIVDEVQRMFATTATVFQRMNDNGDMLRISTTAKAASGSRAIGTFIPAVAADGTPNPAVSAVLKGKTYLGRAFVDDTWLVASYQPITNSKGNILGMIYTEVPEAEMRDKLARYDAQVSSAGETDIFVLHAAAKTQGLFVLSSDKTLEGHDSWNATDAKGNLYVQEICRKALEAQPGDISESAYWLQREEGQLPEKMIARFTYFPEWDWVIGEQRSEDDLLAAPNRISRTLRLNDWLLPLFGLLAAGASLYVWRNFVGNLSGRIASVIARLVQSSRHLEATTQSIGDRSTMVATSARDLMRATKSQAASTDETSTATDAATRTAEQNSKIADQMRSLSQDAEGILKQATETLADVESAMDSIGNSNGEVLGVVASINEINFATNIVSVNAAIEAARAGDAGRSFGFIAGEVRSLSGKCAETANQTKAIVNESSAKVKRGSALLSRLAGNLRPVGENSDNIRQLATEVSAVSLQQAASVRKVVQAVERIQKASANTVQAAQNGARDAAALQSQVSLLGDSILDIEEVIEILNEEFAASAR